MYLICKGIGKLGKAIVIISGCAVILAGVLITVGIVKCKRNLRLR